MDWTILDFAHANHRPNVVLNGKSGTAPIEMNVEAGQNVTLDANGTSDPDAGQSLAYNWFLYPEAGIAGARGADVALVGSTGATVKVEVRSACRPLWLPAIACPGAGIAHIILAVTDSGSPHLTSYRRVILNVKSPPEASKHQSQ